MSETRYDATQRDEDQVRSEGREAARAFDQRLRQTENAEREARLATIAWRPHDDTSGSDAVEDALRVVQLEARISELNAYVRSVHESRPWRLIQSLRRLFGRAW